MRQEDIEKLREYKKILGKVEDKDTYIKYNLADEIGSLIDSLISQEDWEIVADDTHRWVESDGWYEVQFMLHTDFGNIYINTESGNSELQEQWSDNNPQNVSSIHDCYMYTIWDWYYFLGNLLDEVNKINTH